MVRPALLHDHRRRQRPADLARLDHPAGGLGPWAENGVRRAAQPEPELLGHVHERLGERGYGFIHLNQLALEHLLGAR